MKQLTVILMLLLTTVAFSQTSKYNILLKTSAGAVISTGTVEILPYGNTYPTGALSLTYDHDGIWSRSAVPDGEYSLYYNGVVSPSYQRFYIGESRLTKVADQFDINGKINNNAIDSVNNISLSVDTLATKGWVRNQQYGQISTLFDANGKINNSAIDSVNNISLTIDTLSTHNWVRSQHFGVPDSLLIYPNPAHFVYRNDTLSIRDTLITQLKVIFDTTKVVKTYDDQTITGTKTFTGALVLPTIQPSPVKLHSLFFLGGYLAFQPTGFIVDTLITYRMLRGFMSGVGQSIIPTTTNSYDFGSSAKALRNIYTNTLTTNNLESASFIKVNTCIGTSSQIVQSASIGTTTNISSNCMVLLPASNLTINNFSTSLALTTGTTITFVNAGDYNITINNLNNIKIAGTAYIMQKYDTITFIYFAGDNVYVECGRSDK